jgi:hypothetical protein
MVEDEGKRLALLRDKVTSLMLEIQKREEKIIMLEEENEFLRSGPAWSGAAISHKIEEEEDTMSGPPSPSARATAAMTAAESETATETACSHHPNDEDRLAVADAAWQEQDVSQSSNEIIQLLMQEVREAQRERDDALQALNAVLLGRASEERERQAKEEDVLEELRKQEQVLQAALEESRGQVLVLRGKASQLKESAQDEKRLIEAASDRAEDLVAVLEDVARAMTEDVLVRGRDGTGAQEILRTIQVQDGVPLCHEGPTLADIQEAVRDIVQLTTAIFAECGCFKSLSIWLAKRLGWDVKGLSYLTLHSQKHCPPATALNFLPRSLRPTANKPC